jgi:hypothetical protein
MGYGRDKLYSCEALTTACPIVWAHSSEEGTCGLFHTRSCWPNLCI